jgi:hypothetical protein
MLEKKKLVLMTTLWLTARFTLCRAGSYSPTPTSRKRWRNARIGSFEQAYCIGRRL